MSMIPVITPSVIHAGGPGPTGSGSVPATPFVYPNIPGVNILLWYRGDDTNRTGSTVNRWNDKSGNARHATFPAGREATYTATDAGFNSKPTLSFDAFGVSAYADIASALTGTEATVFFVGKINNDPPADPLASGLWKLGDAGAADANAVKFPETTGLVRDDFASNALCTATDPTPALTSKFIYMVTADGSSWTAKFNNGAFVTRASNTVAWAASPRIGRSGTVNRYFDGKMAEVIVYDKKLTTAQIQLVAAHFSTYYTITIS